MFIKSVLPPVWRPSPNFTVRRGVSGPDMVVLHYTGMESAAAAAARLCDPEAEVSAHYLIGEDGTTLQLVAEEMRAWHAGLASWGAVSDVNSHSIGIELANPGHMLGYPPFPEPQMAALERLLGEILGRWAIRPERVLGHACIAPGRKIDPGEKFDWCRLARQGLAVWEAPGAAELAAAQLVAGDSVAGDSVAGSRAAAANAGAGSAAVGSAADAVDFQRAARRIGYGVPQTGQWDEPTLAVWEAFAMRFIPPRAGTTPDSHAVGHALRIAARWPAIDPPAVQA